MSKCTIYLPQVIKKELKPLKKTIGIRIRKMTVIFKGSPILFHTAALLLVEDEERGPFPPASPSDQLKITRPARLLQSSHHKDPEANLANVFLLLSFFSVLAACCFLPELCHTELLPSPGAATVTCLMRKPVNIRCSCLTPFNTGPRGSCPPPTRLSHRHRLHSELPHVQSKRNIEEHVRQQRTKHGNTEHKFYSVSRALGHRKDTASMINTRKFHIFCFQKNPPAYLLL